MRKIISLAIVFVMALSLAITVCAEPYLDGFSAYSAYSGDYIHSFYSAQRTCPYCYQKTLIVTCNGEKTPLSGSINCSGIYGHPSDCMIINRKQSTSSGRCYNCYDSGKIYDDGQCQGQVLRYDTHIDLATHTGTGITYSTCLY